MNNNKDEKHDRSDWLEEIRDRVASRKLIEIVSQLEKCRPKRLGDRALAHDLVFHKLISAAKCGDSQLEQLLFDHNVPPLLSCGLGPNVSAWMEVSYWVFALDPLLQRNFASRLLEACVRYPTHVSFALSHSDIVSTVIENNSDTVDFDICKALCTDCNDTRALYALKAMRWYEPWANIRELVFDFFFSKQAFLKNAAFWILAVRAKPNELQSMSLERGLMKFRELAANSDVRSMLKALR